MVIGTSPAGDFFSLLLPVDYENCGLNQAKPDFLAGCGLTNLWLPSWLISGLT